MVNKGDEITTRFTSPIKFCATNKNKQKQKKRLIEMTIYKPIKRKGEQERGVFCQLSKYMTKVKL